jgi:hypothetical protein
MSKTITQKIILALIFVLLGSLYGQNSGSIYRRSGVLNGNQVKTVFGNWGVIGQPATKGPRGAWIYDTNGYIGDVSPVVGAEVVGEIFGDTTTFHWMIDVPVARPTTGGFDTDNNGNRQAFEPVRGYFNESGSSPAISNKPSTWPLQWADKMDDPSDPGWPGSWNGIFGKQASADLETYFVLDDNNDNEFNLPEENAEGISFYSDPDNTSRFGLGLEMKVRGLQWQQILAQDNIFWVYEVTNQGKTTYPKTVFGMLVGTYVGVTGGDDGPQEYDNDWSFFDVQEDLTYTGNFVSKSKNPFWQGPMGIVGYAFLESPGNKYDGIDNDGDGADSGGEQFEASDFDSVKYTHSDKMVTIDPATYERTVVTFPEGQDTFKVMSMGVEFVLVAGKTGLIEGDRRVDPIGYESVNANAYDGIDNDLDGLIDENYFLHFRQKRLKPDGSVLFDFKDNPPLHHINYLTGAGINEGMIDEARDDGVDNDNDWSRNAPGGSFLFDDDGNFLDDVGADGLPNTGDFGENDGIPTAGEPNFDRTDKDESDQIGLSSFEYFVPANQILLYDDEDMWDRFKPGFFEVPNTFVNGRPTAGEDGDFVYGSGYFPLTAGQTERMSLALIYAWTLDEMVDKLKTVRDIYNADYRFPKAPDKPTLTAVGKDGHVVLYWDRAAEKSYDPVLKEYDFEGYRLYKATDPNFNDAKVVTNSDGTIVSYKPLAQYDLINDYWGYFYPNNDIFQTLQGWSYYLGDNSGLKHTYIDYDVDNGRRYFYALVSYDRGADSLGVIPSECTKSIVELPDGTIELDINTAMVTPGKPALGYSAPEKIEQLEHTRGDGSGTIEYEIIDDTRLTGHQYEVYFWDTSNDGVDNNNNWDVAEDDVGADGEADTGDMGEGDGKPTTGEPNFDYTDAKEMEAITTQYAVKDLHFYNEEIYPDSLNYMALNKQNIVENSVTLRDGMGMTVSPQNYIVDYKRGLVRPSALDVLDDGAMYVIAYQYHPVYYSSNIQGSIWLDQETESDIFDGLTLNFSNIWSLELDDENSYWNNPEILYPYQLAFDKIRRITDNKIFEPVLFPSNYELQIFDTVVDTTSDYFKFPNNLPTPRKFKIVNTTTGYTIDYAHGDTDGDSLPSVNERIAFIEKDPQGEFTVYTWQLMLGKPDDGYAYEFAAGDKLILSVKFPFNRFDTFSLQTELPKIDSKKGSNSLSDIQVYPNPYIVAHAFESALPPNQTSGRGERIIFFSHLPKDAKIHIFTIRGEHMVTLKNENDIFNGTVKWNIKTKENLDVAYGVYLYVIESSLGVKKGKLAIIK